MKRKDLREEKNRVNLDYEEKKEEIVKYLESGSCDTMVLATASDDRVLARTVLIFSKGLELSFFTWGHSRKCQQIRKNPNIALCKNNMMIEGVAEIVGGLTEERTREYADFMRTKNPESIERWEKHPNMVIVVVRPTQIVYGSRVIDGYVYIEFMDLKNGVAYAEKWAHY